MIGTTWSTSKREYSIHTDQGLMMPVDAGHMLEAQVFRPAGPGRFPAILSPSPYAWRDQVAPLLPEAFSHRRGHMESGDPTFYARRGYAHVLVNIRGTGRSGGEFDNLGHGTIDDVCDAVGWVASQPWCDGQVAMFGASYFSVVANRVAARPPDGLTCVFAPYAWTDAYRDRYYQGGIFNHGFTKSWFATLPSTRFAQSELRSLWGDGRFLEALESARADPELSAVPFLVDVLARPEQDANRIIADLLLQPLDGEFYRQRSVDYGIPSNIPAYFGACWGVYGNHLPGAFRSYEHWNGEKKLTIGPPIYLDRPLYQYAYESLRWFDHFMKGNDTGMLEEPPVVLFVDGSRGEWRTAESWPLPETRWTPFYLHSGGLLSEHEFWPAEPASAYTDSPYCRGEVAFTTPPMVEATEVCGPMALTVWASTSADELLLFVSILYVTPDGNERLLTRGWLRGSQRELDLERSLPWAPYHRHAARERLEPGQVYEFDVEIRPYAVLLEPGTRLRLRIKSADDETPQTALEAIAMGHLHGTQHARVQIFHDDERPSRLLLPITRGNRIGTFISGGVPSPPG
ncbi:MAG TPA: CocE/NonD family hydrolase [Acidimicrobiales bacterium]|nr:CocE/NonD family hydrolase [Acidimicrobiales bacterium]